MLIRTLVIVSFTLAAGEVTAGARPPAFSLAQRELFSAPAALSNAWADLDGDGDLDISLTATYPTVSHHPLLRNDLPAARAGRSLQVRVLDREGRATRAGAEVRLFAPDGALLGTRLVATGDGYSSQSDVPMHFGLPQHGRMTVEVMFLTPQGRRSQRAEVDTARWIGRVLVVRQALPM